MYARSSPAPCLVAIVFLFRFLFLTFSVILCLLEHSNSDKKFRFDSRYQIDFFDSIRQSDKFAACTLVFKW